MTRIHRVREGETLSAIATLHGVPVRDVVAANPGKPCVQLPSGAVVFATLGEGEDIALEPAMLGAGQSGACLPGERRDASGRCFPIAALETQCQVEGYKTDDGVVHPLPGSAKGAEWRTTYTDFDGTFKYLLGYENPHWADPLEACTQVYYVGPSGQEPTQQVRHTWKPTVPVMAFVAPVGTKVDYLNPSCPIGQVWDEAKKVCVTPSCPAGQVWNAAQKACVTQQKNPCPPGYVDDGHHHCVKTIGPGKGLGPSSGPTPPPTSQLTKRAAPRAGAPQQGLSGSSWFGDPCSLSGIAGEPTAAPARRR